MTRRLRVIETVLTHAESLSDASSDERKHLSQAKNSFQTLVSASAAPDLVLKVAPSLYPLSNLETS